MSLTIHAANWKDPNQLTERGIKTVCSLRRPPEQIAKTPTAITCGICAMRVLNEGHELGLPLNLDSWTWAVLKAPDPQEVCDKATQSGGTAR